MLTLEAMKQAFESGRFEEQSENANVQSNALECFYNFNSDIFN